MDEQYWEHFLKANARPDIIGYHFADVLRNLLRAVSADDPSAPIYAAAKEMKMVADLMARCDEDISFYNIFTCGVADIQEALPEEGEDRQFLWAAKRGIKFLVESSARDNAARGRASQRLTGFFDAIQSMGFTRGRR